MSADVAGYPRRGGDHFGHLAVDLGEDRGLDLHRRRARHPRRHPRSGAGAGASGVTVNGFNVS